MQIYTNKRQAKNKAVKNELSFYLFIKIQLGKTLVLS